MKKVYLGLFIVSSLIFSGKTLYAQDRLLRGRILDRETGEILFGATVKTKKGQQAVSDLQGAYRISVSSSDTLSVHFVGFATRTIPVSQLKDHADIFLSPGQELEIVTVTASIASARNIKAIGAKIDKLDITKLLSEGGANSLTDALDGRIGGVQMYQSNGKVGMPLRFNMRSGSTMSMDRDPIIYVDGLRYNNTHISDINTSQDALSALNDLSLEDIASIDVIKGPAAAASYGAEAANGVIVITTKRNVRPNSRGMDGQDGKLNVNLKYTYGHSQLARKYNQFVNNDDLNSFFVDGREHRMYANLGKSFSRGNDVYFSINRSDVSGIVPGNRDKRTSLRAAYDLRQNRLSLSLTANYINGEISLPQTAQGRYDAIWNLMINQKPWPYIHRDSWFAQSRIYDNDRILGSLRVGYLLPWEVKLESTLGLDINSVKGVYLLPYGYLVGQNDEGAKDVSNRHNANVNWDIKLHKQFNLGSHWRMTASLLSQLSRRYEQVYKISSARFGGDVENIGASQENRVSESDFEQRVWGLYAEAFFNYKNKFFINAGLRRDASNLIGSEVANILYPSLSLSYNVANLKLRTAYGESGRLPYPTDARTSYVLSGNSAYGATIKPQYFGNSAIKPERMKEFELGLDWQTSKHQFSFTGYTQYTTDAIVYESILPSEGWIGNKARNVGGVRGWGLELSYKGLVWENKNYGHSLELFATFNYQGNKVVDTGGADITNYPNVIRQGLPVYAFYDKRVLAPAYRSDGTYDAKAGAIESSDYHYLGKPFPDFNGGFGLDFRFMRDFSLGVKFNYALGASVYNQSFYNVAGLGDNLLKRYEQLQRLKQEKVGSDVYKAISEELAYSSRKRANYIEKADFLRLSTISIGYDLSRFISRLTHGYIRGAKLSLSTQNLWLITSYSGAEPQVEANGGTRQLRGIGSLSRDITNAPSPMSIVGSVSINF